MGLRAVLDTEGSRTGAVASYRAIRASASAVLLVGMILVAGPASGQRVAMANALVQVPAVSELDVVLAVSGTSGETGVESQAGVFRVRVRANHGWRLVVATAADAEGTVWVRNAADGSVAYQPLEPGMELGVASGDRGETVLDVEYRIETGTAGSIGSHPLTYTLAER